MQRVRKGYAAMNASAPNTESPCPSDRQHFVTFRLGPQTYGLPIECITQIVEMVTITPLPQMSDLLEGLITVKGRPVPVISLRRCLGLPRIDWHLHTPLILVQMRAWACALVVDAVLDVTAFPCEQISAPDQVFPRGQEDVPFVAGVVRTPTDMILLLDPEQLIWSEERDLGARLSLLGAPCPAADSAAGGPGGMETEDRP